MTHTHDHAPLAFWMPATYRIRVQGGLDVRWSERLGGLEMTVSHLGQQGAVTTLLGPVRDQAELIGIVNSLYDLRLPLLSVELLNLSA